MSAAAPLPEVSLAAGTRVIADLHLNPAEGPRWQSFQAWLARLEAPALLVLGDLFEYWTGPGQARLPEFAALLASLEARSRAGTALHFLHGNRDFLLDESFARAVGAHIHPAGCLGLLPGGGRVLFLHGDELATRDRSYQRLRWCLRSPVLRGLARQAPEWLARAAARRLRARSRAAVAAKPAAYVELQASAAEAQVASARAVGLVCGHAHAFREERLRSGARWLVLDAFGQGPRDSLRVAGDGTLLPEASGAALPLVDASLSSPGPMIIALDGPAGAGKSTVARALARELGFFFLDTGAMYRAVTLTVLARGLDPADEEACATVAHELALDFDRAGRIRIDGRPGEPAIRSPEVTRAVSAVSAHARVREAVVARQRELARSAQGVVAEGRDTTTVVFPRATHKFYLSASVEERARRRARQDSALARLPEIRAELERRDALDSNRAHSPLRAAEDAQRVETDGLDVHEVVARILALVREGRR